MFLGASRWPPQIVIRYATPMQQPGDDIKLTWDDLIVDNVTPDEAAAWLGDWDWLGIGRMAPIFLSRFGNWFFYRPDGSIHMLEVSEAVIEQVCAGLQPVPGGGQHAGVAGAVSVLRLGAAVPSPRRRCGR